jgi:hypothetical protein
MLINGRAATTSQLCVHYFHCVQIAYQCNVLNRIVLALVIFVYFVTLAVIFSDSPKEQVELNIFITTS